MTGKLKPYKPPSRAGGAYRRAKARVGGARSKPADRANPTREQALAGSWKFGEKARLRSSDGASKGAQALVSGYAGLAGGMLGGAAVHGAQHDKDRRVAAEYKVAKSRAHLITDVGTAYGRQQAKRWPHLKPAVIAASGTAGAGLGYGGMWAQRKDARGELDRMYRKQQRQQRQQKVAKAAQLERYKLTPKERRKDRVERGLTGAALGAGIYEGQRQVHNNVNVKAFGGAKSKFNPKLAGAIAGGVGLAAAAGKYDDKQYRVVQKSAVSAFGVNHG